MTATTKASRNRINLSTLSLVELLALAKRSWSRRNQRKLDNAIAKRFALITV